MIPSLLKIIFGIMAITQVNADLGQKLRALRGSIDELNVEIADIDYRLDEIEEDVLVLRDSLESCED